MVFKYLMLVDIPDLIKPNVFLIRASEGQQMDYILAIGTWRQNLDFLGTFLHLGPEFGAAAFGQPDRKFSLSFFKT